MKGLTETALQGAVVLEYIQNSDGYVGNLVEGNIQYCTIHPEKGLTIHWADSDTSRTTYFCLESWDIKKQNKTVLLRRIGNDTGLSDKPNPYSVLYTLVLNKQISK